MRIRLDPALPSTEHWRITHLVLRLLDGQHAELRICATAPRQEEDPQAQEHCCYGLAPPVLANGPEVTEAAFEPAALPGAPADEEPVSWTAVVPLEALPEETREVLRTTRGLYECEQVDLGTGAELERLLQALGTMVWTPEGLSGAVH